MGATTTDQVLELSKWPNDKTIRFYLLDRGRVRNLKHLWVETHGIQIELLLNEVNFTLGGYWLLGGVINHFPHRSEYNGFEYTLTVGMGEDGYRLPTGFTVHEIPLVVGLKCECCGDGTEYMVQEDDYWCPNCHHSRPFLRLDRKPEVHGTYPPHCTECGEQMQWVGNNITHCSHCGRTV